MPNDFPKSYPYIPLCEATPSLLVKNIDGNFRTPYYISLPATPYIVLCVAQELGRAGCGFSHPSILKSVVTRFRYSRLRQSGNVSKSVRSGVAHYFAVPASKLLVGCEAGYARVQVAIGRVRFVLEVDRIRVPRLERPYWRGGRCIAELFDGSTPGDR